MKKRTDVFVKVPEEWRLRLEEIADAEEEGVISRVIREAIRMYLFERGIEIPEARSGRSGR